MQDAFCQSLLVGFSCILFSFFDCVLDGVALADRPIREFGKRLLVLSETPIEQIWTLLSMWESSGTARKLIKGSAPEDGIAIDPNVVERKATRLAYCIRTARENILGSPKASPCAWSRIIMDACGLRAQ